jgi:nucleoside-diphosphate-sugar epimerase
VYGDHNGAWVDEDSSLRPEGYAGESIAAAERLLLDSPFAVSLVRFAGIYGRAPSYLLQRIQAGGMCRPMPVRYGNRIHRDDCVGFLLHLLQMYARGERLERIYLGVDDAPVSQFEVESWLARRLGIIANPEPQPGVEPRNRRAANKRCSNRRLHASGYQLQYPDFQRGYESLLGEMVESDG